MQKEYPTIEIPNDAICKRDAGERGSDASIFVDKDKVLYKKYSFLHTKGIQLYHVLHNFLSQDGRYFQNTSDRIVNTKGTKINKIYVKVLPLDEEKIGINETGHNTITVPENIEGQTLEDIESIRTKRYVLELCSYIGSDIAKELAKLGYSNHMMPTISPSNIKVTFDKNDAYLLVTDIAKDVYGFIRRHEYRQDMEIQKIKNKTQKSIKDTLESEHIKLFKKNI